MHQKLNLNFPFSSYLLCSFVLFSFFAHPEIGGLRFERTRRGPSPRVASTSGLLARGNFCVTLNALLRIKIKIPSFPKDEIPNATFNWNQEFPSQTNNHIVQSQHIHCRWKCDKHRIISEMGLTSHLLVMWWSIHLTCDIFLNRTFLRSPRQQPPPPTPTPKSRV